MTLESSGNFGYFVWLPSRRRRSLRGRGGGATATVQNAAMFNLRQTNEQTRRIVKFGRGTGDLKGELRTTKPEAEPLTTPLSLPPPPALEPHVKH